MEKEHFNPDSKEWIVSLLIMLVLCVIVVIGSVKIYSISNSKYNEGVGTKPTISVVKPIDISSMAGNSYNIETVEKAYDSSGELVAYVVTGKATGYNYEKPIEMKTVISTDASIVYELDIIEQNETEYLGARVTEKEFMEQFAGRYLPVVPRGSNQKGSPVDMIAKATISSTAVIDGVNNAKNFCLAYIIEEE